MDGRMMRNNPPVNVGDEIDVTIESVGEKGDGVAKKDGFVLFVPGAQQGQHLRIKVTRVLKKVGFAESLGEAQGAPESSNTSVPQGEAIPDAPEQETPEEQPEDTEDFGEEPEEKKQE